MAFRARFLTLTWSVILHLQPAHAPATSRLRIVCTAFVVTALMYASRRRCIRSLTASVSACADSSEVCSSVMRSCRALSRAASASAACLARAAASHGSRARDVSVCCTLIMALRARFLTRFCSVILHLQPAHAPAISRLRIL